MVTNFFHSKSNCLVLEDTALLVLDNETEEFYEWGGGKKTMILLHATLMNYREKQNTTNNNDDVVVDDELNLSSSNGLLETCWSMMPFG